jgi:hypothetical protein
MRTGVCVVDHVGFANLIFRRLLVCNLQWGDWSNSVDLGQRNLKLFDDETVL